MTKNRFQAVDRFEVVTLTVDSKVISENWNLHRNLHTKSNQCAFVCLFILFDLILDVQVNNFSVMSGRVFWVDMFV